MKLSGWGKYPVIKATVHRPIRLEEIAAIVKKGQTIARGNGRAYGDSAINPNSTIDMTACNRLLAFDPTSGQLVAEAGVSFGRHHRHFRAKRMVPPVVPGTKFVTLGGMVAADVHGKTITKTAALGGMLIGWISSRPTAKPSVVQGVKTPNFLTIRLVVWV